MSELPDIVAVMVSVSVDGPYSYRVPYGKTVVRGSIVAVPLVGRLTLGVVWGEPKDNFAHNRLKNIEIIYDVPPLSDELLKTVDWVSRYTLAPPGLVLRSVLRSTEALEPDRPVTAFRRTGLEPEQNRLADEVDQRTQAQQPREHAHGCDQQGRQRGDAGPSPGIALRHARDGDSDEHRDR